MLKVHDSHNQFNFKDKDFFKTENYQSKIINQSITRNATDFKSAEE